MATAVAVHPQEAVGQHPAGQVGAHFSLHEAGDGGPLLASRGHEALQLLADHLVEQARFGLVTRMLDGRKPLREPGLPDTRSKFGARSRASRGLALETAAAQHALLHTTRHVEVRREARRP